jgi:hypothetical protein
MADLPLGGTRLALALPAELLRKHLTPSKRACGATATNSAPAGANADRRWRTGKAGGWAAIVTSRRAERRGLGAALLTAGRGPSDHFYDSGAAGVDSLIVSRIHFSIEHLVALAKSHGRSPHRPGPLLPALVTASARSSQAGSTRGLNPAQPSPTVTVSPGSAIGAAASIQGQQCCTINVSAALRISCSRPGLLASRSSVVSPPAKGQGPPHVKLDLSRHKSRRRAQVILRKSSASGGGRQPLVPRRSCQETLGKTGFAHLFDT